MSLLFEIITKIKIFGFRENKKTTLKAKIKIKFLELTLDKTITHKDFDAILQT